MSTLFLKKSDCAIAWELLLCSPPLTRAIQWRQGIADADVPENMITVIVVFQIWMKKIGRVKEKWITCSYSRNCKSIFFISIHWLHQILFQSSFPTVLKYSRLYSNTNNEKVIRALGQSVLRNNNMFNCNIGDEYSWKSQH